MNVRSWGSKLWIKRLKEDKGGGRILGEERRRMFEYKAGGEKTESKLVESKRGQRAPGRKLKEGVVGIKSSKRGKETY